MLLGQTFESEVDLRADTIATVAVYLTLEAVELVQLGAMTLHESDETGHQDFLFVWSQWQSRFRSDGTYCVAIIADVVAGSRGTIRAG
jgi:hypothetical protein